jgi:hypothetical protein
MIHCPVHSNDNRFFRQQNHFLGVNSMRFWTVKPAAVPVAGQSGGTRLLTSHRHFVSAVLWWGEATDEPALSELLETIL